MSVPLLHKRKPALGLDIGYDSIKVVQLEEPATKSGKYGVVGYGYNSFNGGAIDASGVITDYEEVSKAIYQILTKSIIGGVSTNKVVAALPVSRTFTRVLQIPDIDEASLGDAVRIEVEQYVPMALDDLYLDYEVTYQDKTDHNTDTEILMVAAPKKVVDSYYELMSRLGLEIELLETSLLASVRAVQNFKQKQDNSDSDSATLLIDFGAKSSDLSIFDSTIRVTGTVQHGGDSITKAIAKKLNITPRQALTLKTRYGIKEGNKHQKEIEAATESILNETLKEINKMLRYYKSRAAGSSEINQIQLLGGGANMPGLAEYIETKTKVTTEICNPWEVIDFGKLQEPHHSEISMFTTSVGLALPGVRND